MLGGQLIDFFICRWFGHPWQVYSVAATPVSPVFHKGSKQNTARDWVQMTRSEQMSEPRNSCSGSGQYSGTLRAGKCLITSSIRKLILCQKSLTWWQGWWLDVQLDVIHSGSRRIVHGNWTGDNWLKLHHMKKVITRREKYNQEIFWISGITILQGSHNYCICIGHGRTLCQKKNMVKSFIQY